MQATASPRRTTENGRIIVTLALSLLLASLGTSIANIALPTLAGAFAAPFAQVQWVVIAYLAALTVSVVAAGRLGDVHGLRRMLVAGAGLFAVASLACGLAPTLPALIAARAVQGVGAAFLMTLSLAMVRETMGEAQTGRAMGLLGTVSALGTAMGPTLGGLVIAAAGWRGVFLLQVPLAVLALAMTLLWLPRDTARSPSRLKAILPDVAMLPGLAVNLLVAAVMMTTLLVGPFFLRLGLGLGEVATGLVMSVGPVISILAGVPSGRAVDAWGAGRVIVTGLVLLAAGAIALAVLPGALGVAGYVLGIAVLTPGYQLFQSANNTAALARAEPARRGVVAGHLGLSRNLGLVLGASAMGAVFALGVGTSAFDRAGPAAITQGLTVAFGVCAGLMLGALTLTVRHAAR
jgi:MFS family permease